jgi:hypothetical protein
MERNVWPLKPFKIYNVGSSTKFTLHLRVVLEERIKLVNREIILYFLIYLATACQLQALNTVKLKITEWLKRKNCIFLNKRRGNVKQVILLLLRSLQTIHIMWVLIRSYRTKAATTASCDLPQLLHV